MVGNSDGICGFTLTSAKTSSSSRAAKGNTGEIVDVRGRIEKRVPPWLQPTGFLGAENYIVVTAIEKVKVEP